MLRRRRFNEEFKYKAADLIRQPEGVKISLLANYAQEATVRRFSPMTCSDELHFILI
ncbi:MAG: hypothetical protein PF483_01165 [Halothiobacillus sp.]|jgi:hypothetical protein|nr:hypothetical protein [Halothiobacillus sp.]